MLQSQLVQVGPSDPLTLVVASLVLVTCAAIGCLVPARRAMAIDPIAVLKP